MSLDPLIGTWPDRRLPIPPRFPRAYELVGTALIAFDTERVQSDPLVDERDELGETYLHLGALDLDDQAAIQRFVNRHGIMGARFRDYALLGPFVTSNQELVEALRESVSRARAEAEEWFGTSMGAAWWGTGIDKGGVYIAPSAESLAEFSFAANCVKAMIAARQILAEGRSPRDSVRSAVAPRDERQAAVLLQAGLEEALVLFSPRIVPAHVDHPRGGNPDAAATHWAQAPLYSRLMLQLFNHIAEGAAYRTCKECGRVFVRQEKRAQYRQHRMRGVGTPVFCSAAHASANSSRRSRLRKREKSEEDDPREENDGQTTKRSGTTS